MQRIPLNAAKPGMKLAKEVKTSDGQVLCGPGLELTQGLLDKLYKSDVHAIVVEGHPVEMPDDKPLAQRIIELEHRFSKVKDDPVLRALMKLVAEHMIEQEIQK